MIYTAMQFSTVGFHMPLSAQTFIFVLLLENLDMSIFLLYDQVRQTIMCININESIYHNRGVMTLAAIVRFE